MTTMSDLTKLHLVEKLLAIVSILITTTVTVEALFEAVYGSHPIFTAYSLFWFCLASIICTTMALSRQLVAQLWSLTLNLYFLHRIPLLYYAPDLLDYPNYLNRSQASIEEASLYFFVCVFFLWIGINFTELLFHQYKKRREDHHLPVIDGTLKLFSVTAEWEEIVRTSLLVGLALLAVQFFAMTYFNLGITGAVRLDETLNILLAFTQMVLFFTPIAIFAYLVGHARKNFELKKNAIRLFIIVIISNALLSSRGALLGIAFSAYVGIRFIGLPEQNKYTKSIFIILIMAFVLYPVITYTRYLYLDIDIKFFEWFANFNYMGEVSARIGSSVESYFLWFKYVSEGTQEQLTSLSTRIYDALNGLVPGDIVTYDPEINISKLQVAIGRPEVKAFQSVSFLEQLGGHGENAGMFGMLVIMFGPFFFISFFVVGLLTSIVEKSKVSPFWKYYWIPVLLSTPWVIPPVATVQQTILLIVVIVYSAYRRPRMDKCVTTSGEVSSR